MTFRRAAALAFGLCLVGAASHAQTMSGPLDGPYFSFEGGWNHLNNLSFNASGTPGTASTTENEGFILGGALGWAMEPLRFEVGIDYRDNGVDTVGVTGTPAGQGGGDIHSVATMVNGYYDFNYSWMGLRPYIGAGVGMLYLDANVQLAGANIVSDDDIMPAVQGMVGVRYQLNQQWDMGLGYKFLNGFHPQFSGTRPGIQLATNDYRTHSVLLSVTYHFGAPAAPPPAEAAPAPAAMTPPPAPAQPVMKGPGRNLFLVFFDFDKSTITAAGQQVLDGAAAAYQENRSVRIELTGYTDTVGTQHYNLGLSKRRADAVAAYLARHGVPLTAMDVAWKGKEDLRVQTPDNVREPQNRRVEIILP